MHENLIQPIIATYLYRTKIQIQSKQDVNRVLGYLYRKIYPLAYLFEIRARFIAYGILV